jgi:hypothetical protein
MLITIIVFVLQLLIPVKGCCCCKVKIFNIVLTDLHSCAGREQGNHPQEDKDRLEEYEQFREYENLGIHSSPEMRVIEL